MFFILLIIIVGIIARIYSIHKDYPKQERYGVILVWLLVATIVLLPIGLFAPLQGYEERQCIQETELIPLKERQKEGTWYIEKVGGYYYYYAFNNMNMYGLAGEAYEEEIIEAHHSIKTYESDECKIPILKEFESKGKMGFFSFAIGSKKIE